jgi:hypothetical protein
MLSNLSTQIWFRHYPLGMDGATQRNKNQKVAAPPSAMTTKAPPNKSVMSLSPMLMSLGGTSI